MTKPTFIVQTFVRKRGRLVPGTQEVVPTSGSAIKKAEAVSSRALGSAALAITVDEETGEVQSAEILGTWGEVPNDFKDSLMGG